MAVARFLQVSDLHLGRPFGWLPAERRADRRRDQREALETVVKQAIERGVHAILLPGDLFDDTGVDAESLAFALHAFEVTGCPPVMIAPGNHDPYFDASPYWSPRVLKARGFNWPDHVHVFDTPTWSMKELPGTDGVRVWGRCFTPNMESAERPLSAEALRGVDAGDHGVLDVAVFHGSLEGKCPPGQAVTAPFSQEEVLNAPFAYMATGHYHMSSRVDSHDATSAGVRLAYAGSAVSLDMTEVGLHGALELQIKYGEREAFVEMDFVQLDERHIHDLEVDVTSSSSPEEVDRRIVGVLDEVRATKRDLVSIHLKGRLVRGVRYSAPGPDIDSRTFYSRVDTSRVRPDYDLDSYRQGDGTTTEERFARALLEQLDKTKDAEERAAIESALYYGLDAFRLREVVPAYEDITR